MNAMERYQQWCSNPYFDEATRAELKALADAGNTAEIQDRFYRDLAFGTGGLRGILGAGSNRMNLYTVRKATQGLANFILKKGTAAKGVAISFDSRHMSPEFAEETALCLNANGIPTYRFDSLRPVPMLSFAVRTLGCTAGVMITASHNPPAYNGYKVYWDDGAQVTAPLDREILDEVNAVTDYATVKTMTHDEAVAAGLYHTIGQELDDRYMATIQALVLDHDSITQAAGLKIVYTPLHGTGNLPVRRVLSELGFRNVFVVPEQEKPDGDFPTVKSPNPENPEGFYLAVDLAKQVGSDLIIGTDPDSDRVGTMVRGRDGEYHTITGNQMGVLLLDYIINAKKANGTMPENPAFIKTIVTTNMGREVAERNGVHVDETFTGFKFMAEKLAEYKRDGSYNYLLAYEESYGYMVGDYVRDKDAVTASMLIAEMAASYFKQGMTLADALEALYEKYGYFGELTLNLVMPGLDGLEKMRGIMASLRAEPPKEIGGAAVLGMRDYQSGTVSVAELGVVGKTPIAGSNVLYFELDDGTAFIVRPSGTEPKIKIYILAQGESHADCDERIARYRAFAENLNK